MKLKIIAVCLLFTAVSAAWQVGRSSLSTGRAENPAEEDEKGRQLRRLHVAYHGRLDRKEQALQRFVAGKISLPEAAALFRSADRDSPDLPRNLSFAQESGSEEESYCRQVISWSRALLAWRYPEEAAALVAQMEEWLEWEIRAYDVPLLPQVDVPAYPDGRDRPAS
jgi:hypothetical protein